MKNESKLVDHQEDLRVAKKDLRNFEENMEKDLPKLEKYNELRSVLQELVENPKGRTRRHVSSKRTKREREELRQKLLEFQKKHPGVSVSSLFSNEETDLLEKKSHVQ